MRSTQPRTTFPTVPAPSAPALAQVPPTRSWWTPRWVNRRTVGRFFLVTGGVHIGIVGADAQTYAGFADQALLEAVTRGWDDVFMAHPEVWGLVLAALEITMGLLLLSGRPRAVRLGWIGVIGFHVALMAFGWGLWLWCVPALVLLVAAARAEDRR